MSIPSNILLLLNSSAPLNIILSKVKALQIHEINKNRKCFGEYHHLFPTLKNHQDKFKQYLRMNVETFQYLLNKTEDLLNKNWCNLHTQPILPEEQMVLTLRFLATGSSYTHLSFSFRMGVSTISAVINRTMEVIWKVLYPVHLAIPSEQDFINIADEFYTRWNFPHCLGAIDGRHVRIRKPAHSHSLYFNYKKFCSVILQAVVDARYRFIFIDVGGYGSQNDAGIFKASDFYKGLYTKKIIIPREDKLPNSDIILPYFFIGDGAYPLMENLMKPYPGEDIPYSYKNFNKRLSHARVVVENAFGFVCQKWRIFYTTIDKPVDTVNSIVKCTCLLHNILIDLEQIDYVTSISTTITPFTTLERRQLDFTRGDANEVRFDLTNYLLNDGIL